MGMLSGVFWKCSRSCKAVGENVGRHVYEKEYLDEEGGETYLTIVIE